MNKQDFENQMLNILLSLDEEAMHLWHQWGDECVEAKQYERDTFYKELYVGFEQISKVFGKEITQQIFSLSKSKDCLYPFELYNAAKYLKDGVGLKEIGQMAVDGYCEQTEAEEQEFKKAVKDFESSRTMKIDGMTM